MEGRPVSLQYPKSKIIRVTCQGADTAPLDSLIEFQKDLKSLSATDFDRLAGEIIETGIGFPVKVWIDSTGAKQIVGGTQTSRVLRKLRADGFSVPDVPIVYVEASDAKMAARRVLQDASSYGTVERQGLYEFITVNEIPLDMFEQSFKLPVESLDFGKFQAEFYEAAVTVGQAENIYTTKVKSPIYQPTGDKPALGELFDVNTLTKLLTEIEAANIPDDEKAFLRLAAHRHIVFNYQNIAEYYAHSSKAAQELMENSALVVIDFNKAIEKGFVKLTESLAELYESSYNE